MHSIESSALLVTARIDARGETWATAYDAAGNVTSTTDPLSHVLGQPKS